MRKNRNKLDPLGHYSVLFWYGRKKRSLFGEDREANWAQLEVRIPDVGVSAET